ncbi:protein kinase domain-containing protein [Catenisphaera adipataccumulans]|uniref:non-specific serine/threonine protein kinase n=1 Tax=Catenisphaera adipataccumulans TaxID=700500 RepID=A0A7W8FVV4_9FIRM|nr:hypothetical protein [Catenisphaera adipataccumulans]MBB5183578.1 serine/threonine-protein kinase [Catenisphaera adipataccumulans]
MKRYEPVRFLDRTLYSNVCLARDQVTGRFVVTKSILKSADPLRIHQFHVEIDVLTQIQDPFVPEIMDALETENEFMMTQTYIEGTSLNKMPVKERYRYRNQIVTESLERLESVHRIGFVYMDLKPEHLIWRDHHLYLIDFNACIPIGSRQAILSSYPELVRRQEKLDFCLDHQALALMLKTLYPHSFGFRLLFRILHRGGLRSARSVRRFLRTVKIGSRIMMVSLCLVLSVFGLSDMVLKPDPLTKYRLLPNSERFMNAYFYTLEQKSGTAEEKAQENLYQWIENNWIDDSVYKDPHTALFLLDQAVQSEDPGFCRYLLKQIPTSIQNEIPQTILLIKSTLPSEPALPYSFYHAYLKQIQAETNQQRLSYLDVFEKSLLENAIVLNAKDMRHLTKLEAETKSDANHACLYLEYCLFLKAKGISISIPETWPKKYASDAKWNELYQLWRQAT